MENLNAILKQAKGSAKAVGAFNVYNYETIKGVLSAAKEMKAPVILAFGEKYLSNMALSEVSALVSAMCKNHAYPVCLHLDHCSRIEVIEQALSVGFHSVMYDGSALPYQENRDITRQVSKMAHSVGATVEAELGSVATGKDSHEGSDTDREIYTNPAQAADFIRVSNCDALAVSVGAVHGLYRGTPNIRVDLIREIAQATDIPLVLHGGSDTPPHILQACINSGIRKINVNTEISTAVMAQTMGYLEKNTPHYSVLSLQQVGFVKEAVKQCLRIFENKQEKA